MVLPVFLSRHSACKKKEFMRFVKVALLAAAALTLGACSEPTPLGDTLMFPPGINVQYLGKPGKLYGISQCAQGSLTGHTCLIFPPHDPQSQAVIINGSTVHELQLFAKVDPHNPVQYLVVDAQNRTVLTTTGRHDEQGNIDLAPYRME